MNNSAASFLSVFALILALMSITIIFIGYKKQKKHHKKKHKRLRLQVHFQTKYKNHFMASINSITLTDNQPHTGLVTVVDDAGNSYTGTLSNVVIGVVDPSQDTVTVDPNAPNTIDVQEVNPTGGTTAAITADFTSQGNSTPSTPSAQSIPDGTVLPGLTCQIVLINKVSTQLKLQVAF